MSELVSPFRSGKLELSTTMTRTSQTLLRAETLLLALAAVMGGMAFCYLKPAVGFMDPPAARIVVFHVPMAWLATLWFIISAVYAGRHLSRRQPGDDEASSAAAEIGLLCCALATVTGSIFARTQWGSWWNWDPREMSIFFLLLIYGAYFALRGSVEDPARRGLFSAVYSLLACLVMPFLVFVMPRVMDSLHPSKAHLEGSYWLVMLVGLAGFMLILVMVFRARCALLQEQRDRWNNEAAAAAGVQRPTLVRQGPAE